MALGIRNKTITTIKPSIPNYQKAIISGHHVVSIESLYEEKYMRTHEEVIEAHRIETGANKIHVDYNILCDPEDLAKALKSQIKNEKLWNSIDQVTLLEAKIERYETLIKKIRKLGTAHVDHWLSMPEDERAIRSEIFKMTELATFDYPDQDIEFARRKGVIE